MRRFRLAAVLRARRVKEDAAKAASASARAEAAEAEARTGAYELELERRQEPDGPSARAFVASLLATQALASTLSGAVRLTELSSARADLRLDELRGAAAQRKALERLAERHAAERQRAEERAEQDVADDLSGAAQHRNGRPE
ncbi:MAG: cell envelope biogenesis protein TolA [Dactylosporangium sp.]|nr:flagellar FliJ family protein [Dactylosporangium sp.]NNJ60351.1 cell envelope biogenesis protein TolA [Dactylosporangium sp.]